MISYIQKYRKWRSRPKSKLVDFIETAVIFLPLIFLIRTYFYGLYTVPTGSMETTMLVGESFFADKFTPLFSSLKHGDIISFNDPNFDYSDNYLMNLFQRYVWGPSNWTKRVIGIPGDHIEGKIENGKPVVYRNGQQLEEPYVNQFPLLATVRPNGTLDWRTYDPAVSYDNQPFYRFNAYYVNLAKKYLDLVDQSNLRSPGQPNFYENNRNVDIYDVHLGPDEYWALGDNRRGSLDSRYWGPLKLSLIHGKIVFRLWSIDTQDSWMIVDLIKHPIDFWKRVRWHRFLQVVR